MGDDRLMPAAKSVIFSRGEQSQYVASPEFRGPPWNAKPQLGVSFQWLAPLASPETDVNPRVSGPSPSWGSALPGGHSRERQAPAWRVLPVAGASRVV
jgi:hypothetical protein